MTRVFLGGTCNESLWRENLINELDNYGIDYFNPIVKDWTPECQKTELKERSVCDYLLYVITPKMTGVYSIAEVIDDSNKSPSKTIFMIMKKDDTKSFDKGQLKSLEAVADMVTRNGGYVAKSNQDIITYILKSIKEDVAPSTSIVNGSLDTLAPVKKKKLIHLEIDNIK